MLDDKDLFPTVGKLAQTKNLLILAKTQIHYALEK